jgi:hypothetical protein
MDVVYHALVGGDTEKNGIGNSCDSWPGGNLLEQLVTVVNERGPLGIKVPVVIGFEGAVTRARIALPALVRHLVPAALMTVRCPEVVGGEIP